MRTGRFNDSILVVTSIVGSFIVVVSPSIMMWVVIVLSIMLDTILGYAKMIWFKEKWIWSKFFSFFFKLFIYSGFFAVAYIFDAYFLQEFFLKVIDIDMVFSKVVGVFLIYLELYSAEKSVRSMNDGKGIKFYFGSLVSSTFTYRDEYYKAKKEYEEAKNQFKKARDEFINDVVDDIDDIDSDNIK